jgi:hypothetical protein
MNFAHYSARFVGGARACAASTGGAWATLHQPSMSCAKRCHLLGAVPPAVLSNACSIAYSDAVGAATEQGINAFGLCDPERRRAAGVERAPADGNASEQRRGCLRLGVRTGSHSTLRGVTRLKIKRSTA